MKRKTKEYYQEIKTKSRLVFKNNGVDLLITEVGMPRSRPLIQVQLSWEQAKELATDIFSAYPDNLGRGK